MATEEGESSLKTLGLAWGRLFNGASQPTEKQVFWDDLEGASSVGFFEILPTSISKHGTTSGKDASRRKYAFVYINIYPISIMGAFEFILSAIVTIVDS